MWGPSGFLCEVEGGHPIITSAAGNSSPKLSRVQFRRWPNALLVSFQHDPEAKKLVEEAIQYNRLERNRPGPKSWSGSPGQSEHPDHESARLITSSGLHHHVPSSRYFSPRCKHLAQRLQNTALVPSLSQMLSPARPPMQTVPAPPPV